MAFAPPTSSLLNTLQDSLKRLTNELSLFHAMSVLDKSDGNPATLKAWLVDLEKHVDQRDGFRKPKRTLAYLRTFGPIADFIKDRLPLQET